MKVFTDEYQITISYIICKRHRENNGQYQAVNLNEDSFLKKWTKKKLHGVLKF